jgi:hypothetical protein
VRAPKGSRLFENCRFAFNPDAPVALIAAIVARSRFVALVNGAEVASRPVRWCAVSRGVITFDVNVPIQEGDDCTAQLRTYPDAPPVETNAAGLTIHAAMSILGEIEVTA